MISDSECCTTYMSKPSQPTLNLMIKKSRLRWVGYVERKYDNNRVKRCITWEVEGIRQRGRPKKTWWDCVKNDMESLGLCQKDVQMEKEN